MIKPSKSTFAGAVAAAIATFMLGGCASIPSSGSVEQGPDFTTITTNDFLYFSPYDPPVGGSISDIVQGFLSAGTGPQNDYAVARKYLASNLKTTWQPNQQVVVVDSLPDATVDISNVRATVKVEPKAYVDEAGRLKIAPEASTQTYEFGLTHEAGQWRIEKAPNLTIVSRPVFDVVFRDFALYFFDSQNRYLVPDRRWFPSRATTATRLVNGLIAGPDSWLEAAVKNPLPKGTKLAIDAVTISAGVASVDLNSKVLATSKATRGQIQAQLQATLSQVTGVKSVQISVDRNVQAFPSFAPWDLPSLSLTPVVLTDSSLARLSGNSATAIDGTRTLVQTLKPKDFAVTSENNWAAVTTKEGLYQASLVGFGSEPKLVDSRPNLLAPVFDRQGWLWAIDSGVSPTLKFYDQSGHSSSLVSPALIGKKILSFAVSPEGARLAVAVQTKKGNQVLLLGIVRNASGLPTALSSSLEVRTMALKPVTVSWLDGSNLGILSRTASGWAQPSEVFIGGFETAVTGLVGLTDFIGSKTTGTRYALTEQGVLLQYRVSSWSAVQTGVTKVHFAN